MTEYLELNFPNGQKLYFNLNTDMPIQITGIWLNNGDSLEGKRYNNNPEKLFLVGTINDPDGYVNVREKPSPNSKVVSKIILDNYFYYLPNGDSDWYPIKMKENARIIGYIHKSRIKNYIEFSNKLKQQVIKERTE